MRPLVASGHERGFSIAPRGGVHIRAGGDQFADHDNIAISAGVVEGRASMRGGLVQTALGQQGTETTEVFVGGSHGQRCLLPFVLDVCFRACR